MKLVWNWLLMTVLLMGVTACNYPVQRYDKPSGPVFIPPSSGMDNPKPIPTPVPIKEFVPGDLVEVPEGGYAFQMVRSQAIQGKTYQLKQEGRQVTISSKDETLLISLISGESGQSVSVEACMQQLLERMAEDVVALEVDTPEAVMLGEQSGLLATVQGLLFEQAFIGQLVVAMPWPGRCFTAMGISTGTGAGRLWRQEGSPVFELLLASLTFFIPQVLSPCEIAVEPAYGYSMDLPIRTGNEHLYDGLERQQAYLDVLRGPQGEALSYTRTGSTVNKAGDILDVYEVRVSGQSEPVSLYLDMYQLESLKAPQSFTCASSIPLQKP